MTFIKKNCAFLQSCPWSKSGTWKIWSWTFKLKETWVFSMVLSGFIAVYWESNQKKPGFFVRFYYHLLDCFNLKSHQKTVGWPRGPALLDVGGILDPYWAVDSISCSQWWGEHHIPHWLVVSLPLWKILVSWDYYSQYVPIYEKNMFQTTNEPKLRPLNLRDGNQPMEFAEPQAAGQTFPKAGASWGIFILT